MDFLKKDFKNDPEVENGMLCQVEQNLKEMEKEGFQKSDLRILKACYEEELRDSRGSMGEILTLGCLLLAAMQLIDVGSSLVSISKIKMILDVLKLILVCLFIIYLVVKVLKVNKETITLRNRYMAVCILLEESED